MSERLDLHKPKAVRFEALDYWFFPCQLKDSRGRIVPAPEEVARKYFELDENWLKNYPRTCREKPLIRINPVNIKGKTGYMVQTVVAIPPLAPGQWKDI